jgi:hypothetical protein
MIPKNTTTGKARGSRRERAQRLEQLKATRALEAAKPENIAKANLSKLKTYASIEITTAGYNLDNQIRTFHSLVPKEKELAFALRFNNSQKEISSVVDGQYFWQSFQAGDFKEATAVTIEAEYNKLRSVQQAMELSRPLIRKIHQP